MARKGFFGNVDFAIDWIVSNFGRILVAIMTIGVIISMAKDTVKDTLGIGKDDSACVSTNACANAKGR